MDKSHAVGSDAKKESLAAKYQDDTAKPYRAAQAKRILGVSIDGVMHAIHRWGMWALICLGIGTYVGITASGVYYKSKMQDAVKVGGIVFEKEVYQITKK